MHNFLSDNCKISENVGKQVCLTSCITTLIGKSLKFILLADFFEWAKNRIGRITSVATLPICLVCSESVSVMKEHNIKWHYDTKHGAKMDSLKGHQRID